MEGSLKILVLEDSVTDAEFIQRLLLKEEMRFEFRIVADKNSFLKELEEFSPQVILSDNSLPQFNATEALNITRERYMHIPFILVTGTVSEEYAASIIKHGADDFILKDRMARLPAAIKEALKKRRALKEIVDYKYALDQSAIVVITDQNGIILYANDNFCKISKYSTGELIGKDHRIINSGYHPNSYIKDLWITIANGKIWKGEFLNKAKDGNLYWVDATIIPFLNEKGKPYQFLSIRTDITAKKKAAQELQTAHERLFFHIENSPLGFIEWDNQLQVKYWSKHAENIFGWTEKEFNSFQKDGYGHVFDEDLPWVRKIGKQLINGEMQRNSMQFRNYTKDGRVIWCEWFNSVLKDTDGKVITIQSLVQDITERKKTEENLRRSEIRLNEAQAIAHISNWEIDFMQNVHIWSDEFYRIYGLNKDEVKPSTELFLSLMHPEDADFAQNKVREAFVSYRDSSFNFRFIRNDGITRNGYTEWKFEFDKNGKPLRLYGILQDITERKEAKENLKLLERKIMEQKSQEQKKIIRAIIKAEEKERKHIGQELHDNINQILASTKIFLATAGNKNKEIKKLIQYPIELIDSSIEEIRILCSNLVIPLKNIDLKELVQNHLSKLEQNTKIKTDFTYSVPDEILPDELKLNLYRILQEQLNNIIKHAAAKNVNVLIQAGNDNISLTVVDNGKGFDVSKKRKGIGISNMMNRIESFNGEVTIESSPGKGCRIVINAPY